MRGATTHNSEFRDTAKAPRRQRVAVSSDSTATYGLPVQPGLADIHAQQPAQVLGGISVPIRATGRHIKSPDRRCDVASHEAAIGTTAESHTQGAGE